MKLGSENVIKLCRSLLNVAVRNLSETEANFSGLQLSSLPQILQPGILHPFDFANINVVDLSHNMIDTANADEIDLVQ
jgi:hypothetical protein